MMKYQPIKQVFLQTFNHYVFLFQSSVNPLSQELQGKAKQLYSCCLDSAALTAIFCFTSLFSPLSWFAFNLLFFRAFGLFFKGLVFPNFQVRQTFSYLYSEESCYTAGKRSSLPTPTREKAALPIPCLHHTSQNSHQFCCQAEVCKKRGLAHSVGSFLYSSTLLPLLPLISWFCFLFLSAVLYHSVPKHLLGTF